MTARLKTSDYDRVIALDTQMVFEARPLAQLDWSSISSGPILLLVVPRASAEVDARKRDGRLGQRARDLNRLLEPSIERGGAVPLVTQPVRVDIAYVAAGAIDWGRFDDLERDNPDDQIVAQALHALVDEPARVEIMSFDSRPRAAARRHGAEAIKPHESWLLETEPSPKDHRITELEQRVKLLQANEPELGVAIRSLTEPPLIRYRLAALPSAMSDAIADMILTKNPRQSRRTLGYDILSNPNYNHEYNDYVEALRSRDLPNMHRGLARLLSQYAFEVTIENVGALTAKNVIVELRSGNATIHTAAYWVKFSGRDPPSTERSFGPAIMPLNSTLRTDRAYFYLEESEDPAVKVEYRCQDFRHGRTQILTPVLELTDQTGDAAHIEVRVTASNMRGEVVERCVMPVVVEDRDIAALVDLDTLCLRERPAIAEQIVALMKEDADSVVRYHNDETTITEPAPVTEPP